MRRLVPAALAVFVVGVLVPAPSMAADTPPLTVLFTGDNAGEVAPCGCKHVPAGGLARRKTLIESARKEGPVLVLDAGNALFQRPGVLDGAIEHRARFVLKAMGEVETAAMAVGVRD